MKLFFRIRYSHNGETYETQCTGISVASVEERFLKNSKDAGVKNIVLAIEQINC